MWIVTAKYLEMIVETSVVSLRHRHHRKIMCKVGGFRRMKTVKIV